MLEKLMDDPVTWLILSLISVVSFMFGIYTWLVGRKKELSASQESYELIRAEKFLKLFAGSGLPYGRTLRNIPKKNSLITEKKGERAI